MKLFIVLTLVFALCAIVQAKSDLLINPGFEDGESGWYNWNNNDSASGGRIAGEYSHSRNKSACREISGVGEGCYGQIIPINRGELIEASVWVMNPSSEALSRGAEVYLRIEFWDDEGPLGSGHVESLHINEPTNKWIKLDVKARAPAGAMEARVLAFSRGSKSSSKGKAYFDDFEVRVF